jgi:regulatory protein
MSNQIYTISQALDKATKYCAYQERCHSEVRQKLQNFNLTQEEVEEVIYHLIQENFVNEERYSRAFARGKFRLKHWGKKKIQLALKSKEVSDACIQLGINEIDDTEYHEVLLKLIHKTSSRFQTLSPYQKKAKTAQYIIGRGFESDMVWENLNTIIND